MFGGVSYVELLILYEFWAGERLSLEKAHPRYLRPGRPISVSAVPCGPGIDIWRSCRFIGAMMRSLSFYLVGLAGWCRAPLVLITVGSVILGGKSVVMDSPLSRPRESASEPFLNGLLGLFGYPAGSALALLAGSLSLRYCAARFACRTTTWRLPVPGQVATLVTANSGVVQEILAEGVGREVHWVSGSGPGRKRIRLNRKTPAHLAGTVVQSRPRVWKKLFHVCHSFVSIPDRKRRRNDQDDGGYAPAQIRTGVG